MLAKSILACLTTGKWSVYNYIWLYFLLVPVDAVCSLIDQPNLLSAISKNDDFLSQLPNNIFKEFVLKKLFILTDIQIKDEKTNTVVTKTEVNPTQTLQAFNNYRNTYRLVSKKFFKLITELIQEIQYVQFTAPDKNYLPLITIIHTQAKWMLVLNFIYANQQLKNAKDEDEDEDEPILACRYSLYNANKQLVKQLDTYRLHPGAGKDFDLLKCSILRLVRFFIKKETSEQAVENSIQNILSTFTIITAPFNGNDTERIYCINYRSPTNNTSNDNALGKSDAYWSWHLEVPVDFILHRDIFIHVNGTLQYQVAEGYFDNEIRRWDLFVNKTTIHEAIENNVPDTNKTRHIDLFSRDEENASNQQMPESNSNRSCYNMLYKSLRCLVDLFKYCYVYLFKLIN